MTDLLQVQQTLLNKERSSLRAGSATTLAQQGTVQP